MGLRFTGKAVADGMGRSCDLLLVVTPRETARTQESHEFVCHFVAGVVEAQLSHRGNDLEHAALGAPVGHQ
jgi:hypothetical protein